MRKAIIYTDGAARGNDSKLTDNPSAWGMIVHLDNKEVFKFGKASFGNNNNGMELTAISYAIKFVFDNNIDDVNFISDSSYVLDGIQSWMPKWRKNGWKKKSGEIKYLDTWKQISYYLLELEKKGVPVDFNYEESHVGNPGIDSVDEYVNKLMDEAIEANSQPKTLF